MTCSCSRGPFDVCALGVSGVCPRGDFFSEPIETLQRLQERRSESIGCLQGGRLGVLF